MKPFQCIVLTGAAGRLGRQMRARLSPLCEELRLVDCVPMEALERNESAYMLDLSSAKGLSAVLRNAQAVIHFAGYPREADWSTLLQANVQGVINLWEAARSEKVGRIVYASSNHAVGFYPRSQSIDHQAVPLPDSRYGITKVFMESTAAMFAIKYGVRGFGLRIGHCSPEPTDARMLSHWIHPDDLASLIKVGLQADYTHELVYGASGNPKSWWRNDRAYALGYKPAHSTAPFEAKLMSVQSDNAITELYQGGSFAAAEYVNADRAN